MALAAAGDTASANAPAPVEKARDVAAHDEQALEQIGSEERAASDAKNLLTRDAARE